MAETLEQLISGRIPPQDVEMEKVVLGAMLLDSEAVAKVIEIVEEGSFYKEANRKIFQAITGLFERNEPIDLATVRVELQKRKQLEEIGGEYYLSTLVEDVSSAANVAAHAKVIIEKAMFRQLIMLSTEIIGDSYEAHENATDVIDRAERKIFSLSEKRFQRGFTPLEVFLKQTFETLEGSHGNQGGLIGTPSGFSDLDDKTAGFQPADLVIIAGRPSMGKTAFALNIARNAAVEAKIPVGFFSLEMSATQLAQRMLCSEARLDAHMVRTGRIPENAWQKLSICVGRLAEASLYIDDSPAATILDIRAKARRLLHEHKIGLLIVDYLQLVQGPKSESRQQEISFISRSLKALAKELNIPVLALSQLSRAVEQRGGDHRPQLSDLRESGAIEQDADTVLFVYRSDLYNEENDESGKAEIIIGKQRNGPVGTVELTFIKEYARFEQAARTYEQPGSGDVF